MSLRPMPFLALVTVLGLLAPAAARAEPPAAEPAAAPEAAPTAGALGDTLGEIRARVQALSREAAEAAALRAELATARARIAELETARRTAGPPVPDPLALEDPPVLALLGLAAAVLLGFAAISYWLWRVHRRLRRLVPDDLLDRLVRVEQAHGVLLRMRADRPDRRPPVHPLEAHRDGGGTRGRGVGD